MLDLHCHLLPEVDDGPASMDEALALCQLALDNGITHAVVTPHIHPGRYANDRESIARAVAGLRQALAGAGIPLQLGMAAEVRLDTEVLPLVMQDRVPFLGEWQGRRVMLLEFPHSHIPPGTDRLVTWLLKQNVLPLIAHPERNKDVMRDLNKIRPFVDMGCLLQVTAGALAGRFGELAEERAVAIVSAGWATILASDAHNLKARPPELREGLAVATELLGEAQARALVYDRPWQIAASQFADRP